MYTCMCVCVIPMYTYVHVYMYVHIYIYIYYHQCIDMLTSMETYRPHSLNMYEPLCVQSECWVETTQLLCLDLVLVLGKHSLSYYFLNSVRRVIKDFLWDLIEICPLAFLWPVIQSWILLVLSLLGLDWIKGANIETIGKGRIFCGDKGYLEGILGNSSLAQIQGYTSKTCEQRKHLRRNICLFLFNCIPLWRPPVVFRSPI